MIPVLGLPLDTAEERLKARGIRVTAVEVRSKKGVEGGEKRVIAARETEHSAAELQYAYFVTDVSDK